MAINFPSNPSADDVYLYNGVKYIYDGTKWISGGQSFDDARYALTAGDTFTGNVEINADLTVDTDTLHVDSTNNRVGIGTNDPESKLNVEGSSSVRFGSTANWNFSNLYIRRRASNISTAKMISMVLDGDTDSDTNLTNSLNIWGTYSGPPTTGSTSVGLDGAMNLGAPEAILFHANDSERMRIDSSGNVIVGATSLSGLGAANSPAFGVAAGSSPARVGLYGTGPRWWYAHGEGANKLTIGARISGNTADDDYVTIATTGNVGIGTDSPDYNLTVAAGSSATFNVKTTDDNTAPRAARVIWTFSDGDGAAINAVRATGEAATDVDLSFRTGGITNSEERMRIDSNGYVGIGTSSPNAELEVQGNLLIGKTSGDSSVVGCDIRSIGYAAFTRSGGPPLLANRKTSDGTVVSIRQDDTQEGSISVSGNTVNYNQFLGSHWAALTDWSRPEIKIGTILETINELANWKYAAIEVEGEQKKICYNGTASPGDTVSVEYEGETYEGIVELEANPEFNKAVKVKVNDLAASKAVYGVFVGWNTDSDLDGGIWNDMYVGAVGNYVIRMAAGQDPEIGDLVESNGTGCGVVQDDDIIRTKTVAKITSTIPQVTYDDGSFLVTCVLYCG